MNLRHSVFLTLAFCAISLISCEKDRPDDIPDVPDEPQVEYKEFQLSSYSVAFEAQSEPVVLELNTKYDWSVDVPAAASWCTVKPLSGGPGITEITLTPAPYTDRVPRDKQILTINYNGTFAMLTISQKMPNENPDAPVLLRPEDGATDVKTNGSFAWQSASDPDGDAVSYSIMFSKDGGKNWDSFDSESTVYKVTDLLEKETAYLWKVRSKDSFGGYAESQVRSFTTGDGGAYADGEVSRYRT